MERDGWRFIGPVLLAAAVLAYAGWRGWDYGYPVAAVMVLLAAYIAFFFRDPARHPPDNSEVIVAPADGRIIVVSARDDGTTQIDTFLSVFNVHVNRAPVTGRVVSSTYRPGQFHAAMKDSAGRENERQDIVLDSPLGVVSFAQIAGLIARRIVCRVRPGDALKIGDRIGLIRFGSRMEVVIPAGIEPVVRIGDRVRAGETVIARKRTSSG